MYIKLDMVIVTVRARGRIPMERCQKDQVLAPKDELSVREAVPSERKLISYRRRCELVNQVLPRASPTDGYTKSKFAY